MQAIARSAGRDPGALTGAMYLTVAIDDDTSRADAGSTTYLEQYYGQPAAQMRARQQCYARPGRGRRGVAARLREAGASHLVLRFAGDHERHLEMLAAIRAKLGW